jgi:hypothetical protein
MWSDNERLKHMVSSVAVSWSFILFCVVKSVTGHLNYDQHPLSKTTCMLLLFF